MRMLIILILAALLTACGDNSQQTANDPPPAGSKPTALVVAANPITDKSIFGVELFIDGDGTEKVTFPPYCYGEAFYDKTINRWHVASLSMEDLTGRTCGTISNPGARYEIVQVLTEAKINGV